MPFLRSLLLYLVLAALPSVASERRLGGTAASERSLATAVSTTSCTSSSGRTRVVELHTDWIYCSQTFWDSGTSCRTSTQFQPAGYFFETGRNVTQLGKSCADLVAQNLVPVVECNVPKGNVLVVPAITAACYCNQESDDFDWNKDMCWDFSNDPAKYGIKYEYSGTLDGKSLSTPYIWAKIEEPWWDGCAGHLSGLASGGGYYAFIDTSVMTKGSKHTLVLLGTDSRVAPTCLSAVKHKFTIV